MRVDITTVSAVKDKDIRAMYLIGYAFNALVSPRMILPTLTFFAEKFGYRVVKP